MATEKAGQTAVLESGSGWMATVGVAALQKALAKVLPAVSTKSPQPELQGVLIEAQVDVLRLSGTDLVTYITAECQAEVEGGGGSVLLPAKQLADLLAKIPASGTLDLASDGGVLWGTAQYHLPLLHAASFPAEPGVEDAEPCEVPASLFRRILTACSPIALAADSARPVLGAIALTIQDGRVVQAQATDGTRVARVWADRPDDMVRPVTLVANRQVPATAAKALLTVLDEVEGVDPVPLHHDSRWLTLTVPGVRLQVRLLEGNYPDLGKVLDQYPLSEHFAVNRRALLGALDRMAVVAQSKRDGLQAVILDVDATGITLRFQGETGRGRERVEADAGSLTPLEGKEAPPEGLLRSVGFSVQVLPDVLRWLSGEDCPVALSGRLMPGGWWADEPVRFDVMPVRVQ